MAPRQRKPSLNLRIWFSEYLVNLLGKFEFGIYITFCVGLYNLFLERALPGYLDEIILAMLIVQGLPLDQPRGKVATLIRELLQCLAVFLLGGNT
jgi:hypothetical protein